MSSTLRRALGVALLACAIFVRPAAADPVVDFIVMADSLARTDDAALGPYVEDRAVVVGAAVGQLLDVAFQIRADDPDGARDNVDLARRIAEEHAARGGSAVPQSLVETTMGWTDAQRATKARAAGLEAEAAEARRAGDAAKDVALLQEAESLYDSIDDRRAVAVNRGTQGVAHWYAGDWPAVEAAYTRALEARRAIEDRILEGRTLNGLGSAHFQQAEFEEALAWYEKAIALRERTGDTAGLATSLNYASNCQTQLGRPIAARQLLERALPILADSGDDRRRIEIMHSVGVMYRNVKRYDEAVGAFREALGLIEAAPEFEAGIRLDLAGALREQGRIREAIDEIARAEELAGDAADPMFRMHMQTHRGLAFFALGDIDRAIEELDRARELAIEVEVPELVALAEVNLANVWNEAGRHEDALVAARRALDQARVAESVANEIEAAEVVVGALVLLERYPEALEAADELLARHTDVDPDLLMDLRASRGYALKEMGRYGDARREFRRVQASVLESGRADMEWVPLIGIGDSFEPLAPDSARTYYEASLASLERYRAAASTGAIRTGFLSGQRGVIFQDIVHFYAEQALRRDRDRWSSLAFRTAERARARGLLELVSRSFEAGDDPEIAALLDRLYAIDEADASRAEERERIEDELARRFDATLAATAPWVADADAIMGPDELGAALGEDTVALVYAVGEDASYVWAVDRNGHDLEPLPGRAALQERIVALRDALLAPGFGDRALATQARALYRDLIEPVAHRLQGRDRVWIVPDGVLFEFPFEVLLVEDPGDRPDWRRARFLARDHDLGYAPSANLLITLRARTTASGTGLLALGDPDFSALAPRAGTVDALPPLPQSRREVEALVGMRSDRTRTLLGAEATEAGLRRALEEVRPSIVHLATHGLVDRQEPALTCVALANDPDASQDGYLYTLEILALPLDAELVVLSACDTGRGKLERGEGTIGLTRSFLAAGAKRVVASLWPVADASTSQLMRTFYEALLDDGRPVDEALSHARAALWSDAETAHPYFWAPFVLMGSDAPLPSTVRG